MDKNGILEFAEMIKGSEHTVFFVGAGVSTESGLKDYRSEDGIYHTAVNYGMSPEEILSHDCFFENTDLFYRFFRNFFMESAEPNITHKALAELEKHGKDIAVVTQNIDGLHQKAGSKKVYELHGTTSKFHCTNCDREYGLDYLRTNGENIPHCICGGVLKPDVVLYGEQLDNSTVNGALRAIENADLLIIGGTSLAVYPAAGLIDYYRGNKLVLINKSTTPMDARADLLIQAGLGDVFGQIEV